MQVLLQLGEAYLVVKDYTQALACVSTVQGLTAGCSPVPGLIQLSSLALLGQGKLVPAAAQLCAWLKQGGQAGQHGQAEQGDRSAEEACRAVDAFLKALHASCSASTEAARCESGQLASGAAASAAAAGDASAALLKQLVQQVADAAVERCQGQPAVAVAVVMRLMELEASFQVHLIHATCCSMLTALEPLTQTGLCTLCSFHMLMCMMAPSWWCLLPG